MEQRITAPKGCKIDSVEHDDNSVVIMFSEDKPKFKRGDFLMCITSEITVIFEELESAQGKTFETFYNNSGYSNVNWSLGYFRLCTDKEKQEMLDYMHSKGKDWDDVNMEVIPYVWKPKEGDLYWYFNHLLHTHCYRFNRGSDFDTEVIKANNCFKTEEEAQKYADEFKRILKERRL